MSNKSVSNTAIRAIALASVTVIAVSGGSIASGAGTVVKSKEFIDASYTNSESTLVGGYKVAAAIDCMAKTISWKASKKYKFHRLNGTYDQTAKGKAASLAPETLADGCPTDATYDTVHTITITPITLTDKPANAEKFTQTETCTLQLAIHVDGTLVGPEWSGTTQNCTH